MDFPLVEEFQSIYKLVNSMRQSMKKSYLPAILIPYLLVGVCFFSCAGKKYIKTPIYEDEWIAVRLEEQQTKGKKIVEQNFNHPYVIKEDNLKATLQSIYFRKNPFVFKKSKKDFPAFSLDEIDLLAPHIVAALAKANPNQRIYFSSKADKPGLIFSRDTLSNGVIFIKDDKFNIVFANLNYELKESTVSSTDTGYYTGDPLDKAASSSLWEVAPEAYQSLGTVIDPKTNKESTRLNWLVISNQAIQTKEKPKGSELETPKPYNPEIKTAPEPAKQEPQVDEKASQEKVEKKLKELKKLRDDGLITDQEYQRMKTKILEERY